MAEDFGLLSPKERLMAYQVVGRVTAYQAIDG